ncbi:MAG: cupin domain-containing protein [Anaerolineaceae bacterium]|nr:cupin domain-containing protein [Anaerolineaceae bacterium]MBN2677002.1 cupin domain-containing protein [Anaerolineaceae bacterium]
MANNELIQIHDHQGEGYQPLVSFAGWRVAKLNYLDSIHPSRLSDMERHSKTDEIFILLKGRGVLILGGNAARATELTPYEMETGKAYNIRQNAWHTILLSRDASVLLVENDDTGPDNTEIYALDVSQREGIQCIANRFGFTE